MKKAPAASWKPVKKAAAAKKPPRRPRPAKAKLVKKATATYHRLETVIDA